MEVSEGEARKDADSGTLGVSPFADRALRQITGSLFTPSKGSPSVGDVVRTRSRSAEGGRTGTPSHSVAGRSRHSSKGRPTENDIAHAASADDSKFLVERKALKARLDETLASYLVTFLIISIIIFSFSRCCLKPLTMAKNNEKQNTIKYIQQFR